MIQTPVSAAIEAAIYLRNFFDDLKGVHAIISGLRDTLARLRYVLEAFPGHNRIDEGLRVALGELGGLVQEYDAEHQRNGGRTRVVFSASQLIALTKLDERIIEYVEKRLPPVIFEKPPEAAHRIHTANQVNSTLNNHNNQHHHGHHHNHHGHHGHHGHHHHNSHNNHSHDHSSTLAPQTSMAGRASPQPSNSLQPGGNRAKKIKSHAKSKPKRGNPYLGEMSMLSRQIRPRAEYSQKLASLRSVEGLQRVYSKSFSDLCFSKESSIEWQAFCEHLKPFIDKYWDTTHECCGPILSLVKRAMESKDNSTEDNGDRQKMTKASYEKFTRETSILSIFKETAGSYMLEQWIRDTQEITNANIVTKLDLLVKKFGGMDFCKKFFTDAAGRCPEVVQLAARLLVKTLKNLGSSNALNSLSLAVQGLEILTRQEYHVLLLLESGFVPYAIEAAHKLKDFATTAGTSTTYFPACFKLLSNICATEQGAFILLREDVHSWVVSALSPSWSSLFSEEAAVSALHFFANFHKHVHKSSILVEREVYTVVINAFSKYKSCHCILDGMCEFLSTLTIDELVHFGGTSGVLVELCDALRRWGENENFDAVLLSKQFSLLAMLCANEKNAIQLTALNIIPTIVDFILHTKHKVGVEVLLPIFNVAGCLVEYFQSAKAFEQSGGMNALAAYLRGSTQPESFIAYCCVIHCYLPSALGSINSQYNVLSDCFASVKASIEASMYMLRSLALIAVGYDEYTNSIDANKIGTIALEAMQSHPSNKEVQAQGCHVIAVWADRIRRITHGPDPAASLVATLPYVSSILSAGNSHASDVSVWAEGFFAISQLIVRDIPASVDLFGGPASERVDFTHVFKMCTVMLRNFSGSQLALVGVSELVHKLCKLGEFSRQDLLKVGCDDQFLETLLWAIEQSPSSSSCSRLFQILRILFHVKEMGNSSHWCNQTTAAIVFGMRKFGAINPKLSRTGTYVLHKITTINPSYGTSAMAEVALNALRYHSNVWDIPFRAGTLLLSLTISVANLRNVIAQLGGLPQLWSARKYFDISEANDRGFEKALSLLQHAITTASPSGPPAPVSNNNMDGGGDFYYNNVYTQEAYGPNVRHEHIIDKVFRKSEDVLETVVKLLQTFKVEGWYIKNAIPRPKLTLLKQMFKVPAWEQPLALLECFPAAGQSVMTLYVMTSGMWYQNSGYTSCPFSERLEGFLTWADITHSKLAITDGIVVAVGQASIEVGKAFAAPLLNLLSELQQFFRTSRLWIDVEPEQSIVHHHVNVRSREWVGDVLSSWHDGIMDDDFVDEIKVHLLNSDKSVMVVAKSNARSLPVQTASKIREGCIVEVHQPPIWIPAKVLQTVIDSAMVTVSYITTQIPFNIDVAQSDCVHISDPLTRLSIEEPSADLSPTTSAKNQLSPTNANNKPTNKVHVIPHTTPNPTRVKTDKNPSPQKRRAETSKDKRVSPTPTRNSPPPKKINEENADDKHDKPEKAEKSESSDNIDHKTKQAIEASKWCDNDQEMVAAVYCHGCKMKLCESCDKTLHQHPTKRSHYRKPFKSSAKIKCANDEENDAGLYCKGCEMHFCLECDIYLHKNPNKKGHERVIL